MGDTPTTDNEVADFFNHLIAILTKDGKDVAEAYLITAQPWLGEPIVRWIMDEGLTWLATYLSHAEEMFVTNLVIDVQTNGENSKVYKQLAALLAANKTGNADAINKATKDAVDAWKNIIHWDGSSNTSAN